MLVSKNSAVLATRKWLLKEKAATQWLCLILICDVLPFGFVARLTCWPFCKIDIMSPLSLLPIPVPPASICLGLVGLQSNHLSHVNLQPNLGANRLFQFDDCFSNLFVWPPKKNLLKILEKAANWDSFSRQSRCDSTQCETFNQQTLNHSKCESCNFVWLKINLMIVNCRLSWTFQYLRKKSDAAANQPKMRNILNSQGTFHQSWWMFRVLRSMNDPHITWKLPSLKMVGTVTYILGDFKSKNYCRSQIYHSVSSEKVLTKHVQRSDDLFPLLFAL